MMLSLSSVTPIELVIKNLNTEYNVNKLINLFLIMLEARNNISYAAINLIRTDIMCKIEHNHNVNMMVEILIQQCDNYQFDYHFVIIAYNRLLEECIDMALLDIRRNIRCELGK